MVTFQHILACAGVISCLSGAVGAQESSTNRVAAETDWSVFVENDPKECWSVSTPKEIVNTRDGRVVAATRGQILLMVSFHPAEGVKGQVAFRGGYTFQSGSTVSVEIGDDEFTLFTENEWAWPTTVADDGRLVEAMKRGKDAIVTGVSSRGTTTRDTFSLLGFTAALEEAEARCAT